MRITSCFSILTFLLLPFLSVCSDPRTVKPQPSVYSEQLKSILDSFPVSVSGLNDSEICQNSNSEIPFSCQVDRTFHSLFLAHTSLTLAKNLTEKLEQKIGNIKTDRESRFLQENYSLEFQRLSRESLKLTALTNNTVFLKMLSGQNTSPNQIIVNFNSIPAELGSYTDTVNLDESFKAQWTYTDSDNWTLQMTSLNSNDCPTQNPYRAKSQHIHISKSAGLFRIDTSAKVARWAQNLPSLNAATCAASAEGSHTGFIYTEILANSIAAKGSVYVFSTAQESETQLAQFRTFPMKDVCTTFGLTCGTLNLNTYTNHFCFDANTKTTTWNDNCAAKDASLAATSFSSEPNWVLPSNLNLTYNQFLN